ncbi:MAG: endonuclease IV [Candidatus Phytoplasma cynodontis]|uniref:deoxyribonuclease IV n=1 Tax='Cynodon dactylon' phytoplasma TaxID=295320 RepID=UPI001265C861|nr:deoxyribonuclease IV ['Cynodon dactylon' phytoplasma]KAB8122013.1 deoxyribonuclease IV ['Cynodon dactylon' phytoplasma]WIA07571.1 MAG: endonuclease IV [Candidatus Phytoplasma cynodontis]
MIKIGSHVSFKQPLLYLGSLREALYFDSNTFMIYTGAPQNTIRVNLNETNIKQTIKEIKKNNIDINDLIGHAPYIVNLANPILKKRQFSIDFLTQEILRFSKMEITTMVLHPGNAINQNRIESIKWISEGINQIIKNTPLIKTKIALETMSGKGNEIGYCFEEIKDIINLIENKKRISVCFDTCHVFDSGYDIKNNFELVMNEFNSIIGFEYLNVFHINDSKNYLGSKKDRHENIGFGKIGFDALIKIIFEPKFIKLPKILETPFINGYPPYKEEIDMIKKKKFNYNLKK